MFLSDMFRLVLEFVLSLRCATQDHGLNAIGRNHHAIMAQKQIVARAG